MKSRYKVKLKILLLFLVSLISQPQQAFAQCEIMPIVFRDSLYGTVLGAGIGGIVLVANQDSNQVASKVAVGALVGVGAGIIVSIIELSFSDCNTSSSARHNDAQTGFRASPLIAFGDSLNSPTVGIKSSITETPKSSLFDLERIGVGLNFRYNFAN